MNTKLKTLALISVMLLGSMSLIAQKTLLLVDLQPQMTYTINVKSNVELSAEYYSSSYQFYVEDKLQLKDWMVNLENWETADKSRLASAIILEEEADLMMEDWMIQSFAPAADLPRNILRVEREAPLPLLDWMYCCRDWKTERL